MSNYEQTLETLAEHLVTPERFGRVALQETVEFEETIYPYGIRLRIPNEHGWASGIPPKPDSRSRAV